MDFLHKDWQLTFQLLLDSVSDTIVKEDHVSLDEAKEVMKEGELRENAIDEIADVMIYALAFCQRNNIDVSDAIKKKMEKNVKKYPPEEYKGHF